MPNPPPPKMTLNLPIYILYVCLPLTYDYLHVVGFAIMIGTLHIVGGIIQNDTNDWFIACHHLIQKWYTLSTLNRWLIVMYCNFNVFSVT